MTGKLTDREFASLEKIAALRAELGKLRIELRAINAYADQEHEARVALQGVDDVLRSARDTIRDALDQLHDGHPVRAILEQAMRP